MNLFIGRNSKRLLLYCLLFIFLLCLIWTYRDIKQIKQWLPDSTYKSKKQVVTKSLKYILLWSDSDRVPFVYLKEGQKVFVDNKCKYTNCFVTNNRTLLGDYTNFDVIVFDGPKMIEGFTPLPTRRSTRQKYVFASIESGDRYPICNKDFDKYFNWTWTYKLNSDALWGYLAVRDENDIVIGPKENIKWIHPNDMNDVNETIKNKLKFKTKAVAWFVSDCVTQSRREVFAGLLHLSLLQRGLNIDIFGGCGRFKCPQRNFDSCLKLIEDNYYFYLAFENAFGEDFVTDQVLNALHHFAVPIVFGGADYSRFMPDGIYLDAKDLGPIKLAQTMYELIINPDKYESYFRWHNHYKFHRRTESLETDDYCRFCSMLNDEELVKKTTVYEDFKAWWTPPGKC